MKKVILSLVLAFALCCSLGTLACSNKTELKKELPTEVVCGSEIYFREYLPIDFESEYELTVSYFDCDDLKQVNDEKLDSLMFRFEDVSKYDFKLNEVDKEPIEFSINSVPVVPELLDTADWRTDKGETVLLEDLVFWCNIKLKDEAAKIDPAYKMEFVDVTINSVLVDGGKELVDLSGQNSYLFEDEAEYVFTIKASNISGEHTTNVKVTTGNVTNHTTDVYGYVFEDSRTVEFEVSKYNSFALPADGESLKVRVGDKKYDAVYSASSDSFKVSDFEQKFSVGAQEKLYIADKNGVAYSIGIVVPDLVVTKNNFKTLETVTDGVIVLAEDIDMNEIADYGSTRTGSYNDFLFKGIFDGRGHTISNFKTRSASYTGSLLWSVSGATVKNVIFDNATVLAGNAVVSGRTMNYSKFINVVVQVNELTTTNSSVISGPGEYGSYYENCILYVKSSPSTSIVKSGFVNGLYCRSAEFKNSYLVSDLVDLPIAPSGHADIIPSIKGQYERLELLQAEDKFAQGYDWGTTLLNKAAAMFFSGPERTDVNSGNVDVLQTATDGIYTLTEDIDLSGVTWTPSETFTGTLDGNGYKISNLSGSLFKAINGAKITNLILDNVDASLQGVLCSTNLTKDIEVTNVIVKVASSEAIRMSLLGYQLSGTATLKNVVVDMFNFTTNKDYKAFLTTHAGNSLLLEDVYCIGGNGSLHSTVGNHATLIPSYYKADGETPAVKDEDYFIGGVIRDILNLDTVVNLDEDFQTLINKAYVLEEAYKPTELTQANFVETLSSATNGWYVLTEDVDLSGTTWAHTGTFTGILDGQGYKISNLEGTLFNTIDGARISNLILDNVTSTANGVLSSAQLKKDVELANVIVKVTSATNARTSLLGQQTGGKATLRNVVVDMFKFTSNSDYKAFLTTDAGLTSILDVVYFIGGNGNLHSTIHNANFVTAYYKANGTTPAVEDTDYFIGGIVKDVLNLDTVVNLDEDFKTLINKAYVLEEADKPTELTQANFVETLASATDGWYVLTEDIDLSGITWTPTATFSGKLDGKGYKISNLTGSLFHTVSNAEICNLILDNVIDAAKGILSGSGNISTHVEVTNVIVKVKNYKNSTRWGTSFIGYLTGGTATLKNVVVDMFTPADGRTGFLTTHASGKQILENVYCIGGNGSLHSTDANNATYVPVYVKADGETPAVKNTDYFIGAVVKDVLNIQSVEYLDENFKTLINKAYVLEAVTGPVQINQTNIAELASATDGEYVLIGDIDLNGITWTPTATFSGTLDGQGYKITNVTGSLFKKVENAKISNLILDNVVDAAKGVLCSENLSSNVELTNVIVKVKNYKNSTRWGTALFGYQTGGTATLKNVVVQMFTPADGRTGFLTTHASGKQILENVYCIGGNGSLHSTDANNATYVPIYVKADGNTAAVEDTDYFIYDTASSFESDSSISLDANFKTIVGKVYNIGQ